MPASASYLTKYLTAASTSKSHSSNPDFEDSSRPKKRHKKDKSTTSSTLLIADDDEGLLLSSHRKAQDDDEDTPMLYEGKVKSAEFRKKKSSAWQTAQDEDALARAQQNGNANGNSNASRRDDNDDEEANRILTAAAQESDDRQAEAEMDDAPAIVDVPDTDQQQDAGPKMSSGVKAGLQTAADTAALIRAEEAQADEERRARKKKSRTKDGQATDADADRGEETIYRDATGRRIDISLRRAELRAAEVAKQAAEKKAREDAMGEVQLQQRTQAKEELENAKFLTLGRSAEDEELNEAQKEELRWDDPMAGYMAERQAEREAEEEAKNPGRRRREEVGDPGEVKVKKRVYLGAAAPNRYGIKPGWRWDGVDRGNGFEKEWFQARGKKNRMEQLSYQWQMDE